MPEQRRLIPGGLWHGAEAYGFRGQVWTRARITRVIEEELDVHYHKSHVGKHLQGIALDASDADTMGRPTWR